MKLYRDAIVTTPDDVELRESLVSLLYDLNREADALTELTRLAEMYRQLIAKKSEARYQRNLAGTLWILGPRDEARKLYRERIANSTSIMSLNSFAMEMAQGLDPKDRDGELAVDAATKLCELTSYGNATYLDTLATAYAAKGDFAAAVKWQLKAIELCTRESERKELESNLKVFQAGKALPPNKEPGRRPWTTP